MAFIRENLTGTLGSWASTLLEQCHGGTRRTAMSVAAACKTNEDRELLRDFAIHLLQELEVSEPLPLSTVEQAKRMPKPYSPFYDAEHQEHLFHVLNSLFQPEPYHTENRACRSARALWSPLRADRLLWARQAWEHPEVDSKVSSSSGTELIHFNASTCSSSVPDATEMRGTNNNRTRRSLSKWIHKWCHAFGIPPEQWILILPSREFCVVVEDPPTTPFPNDPSNTNVNNNNNNKDEYFPPLSQQLVALHWDWLLKTLRTALAEWRLDAMFPTLVHPIVHDHWTLQQQPSPEQQQRRRQRNMVVSQCIIFMARVYCAMKALQWDSMESPVLLTKVLRCATLLQEDASRVFPKVDLKELASYPKVVLPVGPEMGISTIPMPANTNSTIPAMTGPATMAPQGPPPVPRDVVPTGRTTPLPIPASVEVTCQKQEPILLLRKRKRDATAVSTTTNNLPTSIKITKRVSF